MHKDNSQTFGIVCLEDLNHKFYGAVVLSVGSIKTRRFEGNGYTIFAMEKSVISNIIA